MASNCGENLKLAGLHHLHAVPNRKWPARHFAVGKSYSEENMVPLVARGEVFALTRPGCKLSPAQKRFVRKVHII
jgi:hypothetical protein